MEAISNISYMKMTPSYMQNMKGNQFNILASFFFIESIIIQINFVNCKLCVWILSIVNYVYDDHDVYWNLINEIIIMPLALDKVSFKPQPTTKWLEMDKIHDVGYFLWWKMIIRMNQQRRIDKPTIPKIGQWWNPFNVFPPFPLITCHCFDFRSLHTWKP